MCSRLHTTKDTTIPLLLHLEDHITEVRSGPISIPHVTVTVADDLAVFARRSCDMQVMVWDIENNTERERYCANPSKSSCLCYNLPKRDAQGIELVMSGDKITCEECTVHLGITRDYLSLLSRSFSDHHLRCVGWLNLEFSKREKHSGWAIKTIYKK